MELGLGLGIWYLGMAFVDDTTGLSARFSLCVMGVVYPVY